MTLTGAGGCKKGLGGGKNILWRGATCVEEVAAKKDGLIPVKYKKIIINVVNIFFIILKEIIIIKIL